MGVFFRDDPFGAEGGEEGVAFDVFVNPRQVDFIRAIILKGLRVNLRAADNADFIRIRFCRLFDGFFQILAGQRAAMLVIAPADDDIDAARQGLAELRQNGFKRLSAHDTGLAHGYGFEMPEIFGDVPRHGVVLADGIVIGGGDDEGYDWFHGRGE